MGYVRERKVYNLVWNEGEFAGLEVKTKAASVAAYRQIAELATYRFSWPPTVEDLARVDELHVAFAAVLVSWNLEEEDGTPVSATVDGLRAQDPEMTLAIILAWMMAVAGVDQTGGGSDSDESRLLRQFEESLPMEVLAQ